MVAVTKDEPDVNEIEQMISMDASLSFALLKMANSVYFALRHRATTIHQAIMTLGLGQLKQWIYLLSVGGTDNQMDVGAEEFLKLSFMRANFCSELMKYAQDMPISRSEAYLMGMFSTLNYLIDAPLEEILNEVPIAEEIKAALLRKEGRCGKLYDLVLSYEAANWNKISSLAEELGNSQPGIDRRVFYLHGKRQYAVGAVEPSVCGAGPAGGECAGSGAVSLSKMKAWRSTASGFQI